MKISFKKFFSIVHTPSADEIWSSDILTVSGSCWMENNGFVYIKVENSSDSANTYSLTLTLEPSSDEKPVEFPLKMLERTESGDILIEKTKKSFRKTSTIQWHVKSIG